MHYLVDLKTTVDFHLEDYYGWDEGHNAIFAVGNAFLDKFNRIIRVDKMFDDDPDVHYLQQAANYTIENFWSVQRSYQFQIDCCKDSSIETGNTPAPVYRGNGHYMLPY
jgi:hypothetical protein